METESPVLSNVIGAQRVGAAGAWPDQRLNHRFSALIADALNPPNASILQATGGDAGQAKGTYRFYQNTRVTGVDLNLYGSIPRSLLRSLVTQYPAACCGVVYFPRNGSTRFPKSYLVIPTASSRSPNTPPN